MLQGAKEEVPDDAPPPLGKRVVFTAFVDANLYHDLISGKSVTGIIHCANQTIDFFPSCSLPLRLLPSVQNTLQPGHARTDPRYPFHLPLPRRSHRTCYGNAGRQRVRCQHSFHAPFEAEQTSQLPFLSQNEIVHCWLGTIFSISWTKSRPIFSVNGTWRVFGRHCVPSFSHWERSRQLMPSRCSSQAGTTC
jgi:hypothetical protein